MNFISHLHNTIPKPCNVRPFVCDGLPQTCTVIVIGENPATDMLIDWWDFWDDEQGFDLKAFEQSYRSAREKTRPSNTRLRLNRLRSHGLLCLETNAYTNEKLAGAGKSCVKNDLLPFLIANLPLKGVIAHGAIANRCLDSLVLPAGVQQHRMRHFRSVSYSNIDQVARRLL